MTKLTIGTITKPQGIVGEVKVAPLTDDPARFRELSKVYLDGVRYQVIGARVTQAGVFLSLQGIGDRNAAELLRGKAVQIDREDAIVPPEGRYLIADLLGCDVYVDGELIGEMADVLQYGSADIYVIKTNGGKRAMIPAIERILMEIDVRKRRVELDRKAFEDLAVYED